MLSPTKKQSDGDCKSHKKNKDSDDNAHSKSEIKTDDNSAPNKNEPKEKRKKIIGDIHFKPKHLRNVGQDVCRTFNHFFNENIMTRKLHNLRKYIRARFSLRKKVDRKQTENKTEPVKQIETVNKPPKVNKIKNKTSITPAKNTSDIIKGNGTSKNSNENKRIVVYPNSSYKANDDIKTSNILRVTSNRASNQISILIKKHKARMANASSFTSLSRFSQPNDSDSSFRNAYNEYKQNMIVKPKRSDSPNAGIN